MKVLTLTAFLFCSAFCLAGDNPAELLLVAPKGAIERRVCEGMKHPVPLKTPEPAYPISASENRMIGDTILIWK